MKKWEFSDYTVYEEVDVLRFENNDGDIIGYVTKNGTEEVEALDNGADPIADGWEDGIGNTLSLEGWGDEWEKLNIYVIYSDDVKAPADVIDEEDDLYFEADRLDEAENTKSRRYAHWYRKTEDGYGYFRLEYISTKNAE